MSKFDKIKTHFDENKKSYILAGTTIVIGVGIGFAFGSRGQISVSNPALVNYKPIATTVQVQMSRPGPKAFVVQCLETQQTWPSIRQAAKELGVSPSVLCGHIKGKLGPVNGLTFEKIAEI